MGVEGGAQQAQGKKVSIQELLKHMIEKGGSDLHLSAGSQPRMRVHGHLKDIEGTQPMTGIDTRQMCYSILTDAQKHEFEERNELDLSFGLKGLSRFRGNVFVQRGSVAGVFRAIPFEIKTFEELNLPPVVKSMAERPRGLVLVTGPTGSGKSTTLAAMVDKVNREREDHIITIEDPIEFMHKSRKSLVNQREVGSDTHSFKNAIKSVLRQDPDVVLLGELRDMETIETSLTISETGHLCFATLHTNSCVQTMSRIIDVFPSQQQPQVRAQLSFVLEGILSQLLAITPDGKGRKMCLEIMVPNAAIRNLIREDKVHQLYSQMQVGQGKYGMQTMNQALVNLVIKRQITVEESMGRSPDLDELNNMLSKAGLGGPPQRRTPSQ